MDQPVRPSEMGLPNGSDTPAPFSAPPSPAPHTHEAVSTPAGAEDHELSETRPLLGRVGRYDLFAVIAKGGMGIVYQARDPVLRRIVALKTMLPGIVLESEHLKRFEREMHAAAGLNHPNIVPI